MIDAFEGREALQTQLSRMTRISSIYHDCTSHGVYFALFKQINVKMLIYMSESEDAFYLNSFPANITCFRILLVIHRYLITSSLFISAMAAFTSQKSPKGCMSGRFESEITNNTETWYLKISWFHLKRLACFRTSGNALKAKIFRIFTNISKLLITLFVLLVEIDHQIGNNRNISNKYTSQRSTIPTLCNKSLQTFILHFSGSLKSHPRTEDRSVRGREQDIAVLLLFFHWLQRLKINCSTLSEIHALFSNFQSTHVIVNDCDIPLLCILIVKLLLLARCFSGRIFVINDKRQTQKHQRVFDKITFLSLLRRLQCILHATHVVTWERLLWVK